MFLARRLSRLISCSALLVVIVPVAATWLLLASAPAAAQTGTISGTVTDSVTGTPLGSIRVDVYKASGQGIGAVFTAASGAYTAGSLAPGDYFVRTNVASQGALAASYLDELYNGPLPTSGLSCTPSCVVTSGAKVSVTTGVTTANIDFALELGGRISGTISPGVFPPGCGLGCGYGVSVYNASGALVGSSGEYGSPAYTTAPLAAGSYYVRSANNTGYINELYNGAADGIICQPSCTVTAGVPVQVVAGQTTPNINFTLAQGGRISGTITDSSTSLPLSGVTVSVYNAGGAPFTSALATGATGVYTTPAGSPLPDGMYFVKTTNSQGYTDELYNNIPCASFCAVTGGTPVTIAGGVATPAAIDFALTPPVRLSGTVKDTAGNVLSGVVVRVYSSSGTQVASATTGSNGAYATTASLASGSYFVGTSNSAGYIDQLYNGIACLTSCTVTSGTPFVLNPGTNTLYFSLSKAARISGAVTSSGTALSGVQVQVTSASGAISKTSITDIGGAYVVSGLPTGSYYVRTANNQGFFDEVFGDIPCLACTPSAVGATLVNVTEGGSGDQSSIDFDLTRGGQITGHVSDAGTGAGVGSVNITVYDATARIVMSTTTSSAPLTLGLYGTTGLPAGRYFVRAFPSTSTNYIAAVYGTPQCAPCFVTDGLPVEVTLGAVTSGIDIALQTGGRVSGSVTGRSSGVPLNVTVEFVNEGGSTVSSTNSIPTTGFFTSAALPPGSYYARTRGLASAQPASQGYINEMYDDVACSGCSPTTGALIPVTAGATRTGINFLLDRGGRISGQVTDEATNLPIQNVTIQVFSQAGLLAGSVSTDAGGNYTLPDGLAAGDYYARTANSAGYINRLYNVVTPCFQACTPTSGTAIHVPASGFAGNVDFTLTPGARIAGTVTDAATGLPLSGITVRAYDSLGASVIAAGSSSTGTYITGGGMPAGTYYVATSNNAGYINKVHAGTPCLGCNPAAAGSAVSVALGATTSGIDFALDKGGRVSGTVVASSDNSPLKGVAVEVFASPYLRPAVTGTTDRLGYYLTGGGLPDGAAYTVRTTNSLGFINERYDDVSCLDGCAPEPVGAVATVGIVSPSTTPSINFALDFDGDQDGDGILGSIDVNKLVASDDFSDLPQGGATAGTVLARNGWGVHLGDLSGGGVQAEVTGSGTGPVTVRTCAGGGAEEVGLDTAGAKAAISCAPDTGSTTVRAVAAFPYIVLRKTIGALTTILELAPGQAATLGSPAVADPGNTEPVRIRLVDELGSPVGSFDLDPGESAEATESASGLLSVTVFSGSVAVTVGETVVTVAVGQPAPQFELCSPLGASPEVLWPPNHKMVSVALSRTTWGTCGSATCRVVSVTSNEATNGLGDGDTAPDWEIGPGFTLALRAERAAGGPGRTYTIVMTCTDEAGRTLAKSASVSVPHSR